MKNSKKIIRTLVISLCLGVACTMTAFAAGPEESLTLFSDLLMRIVRIVGFIVIIISSVFLSAAVQEHNGSQRNVSILGFVSGLILFFLEQLLAAVNISL